MPEIDDRLREWAHFFRDPTFRAQTCASAEKYFRATSADATDEGWADWQEAAPRPKPPPSWAMRRATETNDQIRRLDRIYRWALTYCFCFPNAPKGRVLSAMRHRTNRRMNWSSFLDTVDIARIRLYSLCSPQR